MGNLYIQQLKKEQIMQRRTFLKHATILTTATAFPQLAQANWSWRDTEKAVKVAFWASKLNPVRLVAGLVFDEIAEVYLEPLAKQAFNSFLNGNTVSKSSLSYYSSSSSELKAKKEVYVEPYKASIVTYSRNERTDYSLNRQKKIELELIKNFDKERFAQIQDYFKEHKIKMKLYENETISTVGNDLTPSDLFNIDYIAYGKHPSELHIKNLLDVTKNNAFREVIA